MDKLHVLCCQPQEKQVLVEDNRRMAQLLCISKGDEQNTATTIQQLMEENKSLQDQCSLLRKRGIHH